MSSRKQITIHAQNSLDIINDAIDVIENEINEVSRTAKRKGKISDKERIGKRKNCLESLGKIRREVEIASADVEKGCADSEILIQNFKDIEDQLAKQRGELNISRKARRSIALARRTIAEILKNSP